MQQASDQPYLVPSLWADLLELKRIEEMESEERLLALFASGVPLNVEKEDDKDDKGEKDKKDDDSDDDEDNSDDDDDDEEDPKESKRARKEAFAKLREAEAREKALKKELAKEQAKGMSKAEAAEQRALEAEKERDELKSKEERREVEKDIARIAKRMKFKNPDRAKRFVGSDAKTESEIKAALKEAAEDFPDIIGDGTPPPPVNEGKKSSSNFSSDIRRAAGRAG